MRASNDLQKWERCVGGCRWGSTPCNIPSHSTLPTQLLCLLLNHALLVPILWSEVVEQDDMLDDAIVDRVFAAVYVLHILPFFGGWGWFLKEWFIHT